MTEQQPASPGRTLPSHRPPVVRRRMAGLLLPLMVALALLLSLGWGAVSVGPVQTIAIVMERSGFAGAAAAIGVEFTAQQSAVLWNIRLPRTLMSALVGSALALAGVALQVAFRNQLAEPTMLGVSGAASLGVVLAYVVGAVALGRWTLPLAGAIGAVAAVAWLLRFSWRQGRSDRNTLILSGVALQLFLAGLATLLVSAVRRPGMPDASFLTLGGLTGIFWRDVAVVAPLVLLIALLLQRKAQVMNILLLDDSTSRSLGVQTGSVQFYLVCLAAVATGTVVGYSGTIAFVGLVVPFFIRLLVGDDHRTLLPAAMLGGAALVTVCDGLARNLISPTELPLAVFMAVIGGPLFFWLVGSGRAVSRW